MKKHDQWKNQNGFSLVELVVVMAILSIMGTVLYGFFHTSTRSYKDTGAEVDLQYEAQLTQNQLDNLIIDSTKELLYTYDTLSSNNNIVLSDAQIDNKSEVTQKNFIIDNGDEVYTLQWDLSTSKIYLLKTITKAEGSRETSSPSLLAEYVKEFDVNLERTAKQRVVEFRFLYENNGKTLEIKHNITLRNRVHVNKVGSDSDVLLPTVVDKVLIYEDMHDNSFKEENNKTNKNTELKKGEKIELIAKVIGKNYPSQEVGWTLIGTPTDSSTKLTITGKNTCTFEIGTNETNKVYEIKAVSVADPSKSAVTSISLPGSDRIPGGKGFVRDGPGFVMDLREKNVDMSKVKKVEWGLIDLQIVQESGIQTWQNNSNMYNPLFFNTSKKYIWKPLKEGQEAKDLVYYDYDSIHNGAGTDTKDESQIVALKTDVNDIGKCTITAGSKWGDNDLKGSKGYQAVVWAKVTYEDGKVEIVQFGNSLTNDDLVQENLDNVRNADLFLECVHVKLIKPDGTEFFDFGSRADYWKTTNSSMYTLTIKNGDSLCFRIDGHGYNAVPDFDIIENDRKKMTELLDNYSFNRETGEVFIKPKSNLNKKDTLTFVVQMRNQRTDEVVLTYTVPVEVNSWTTSK